MSTIFFASHKEPREILALVNTKIYTKIIKLSPEINPIDNIGDSLLV